MYTHLLLTHSWLRWPVLFTGVALLVVCWRTWQQGAQLGEGAERLRKATLGLMDLQMLLGLLLYFFASPIVATAMEDMGAAMKDPSLRFFGVEHIGTMLVSLVVLHVGHARAKRKNEGGPRLLFITQCIWLALVLAAIPWPALDIGRPLFRWA